MTDESVTAEERRRKILAMLQSKRRRRDEPEGETMSKPYQGYTYNMFLGSLGRDAAEIRSFSKWVEDASADGVYAFESERLGRQDTEIEVLRETGQRMELLNFSSYNYLGLGYHPDVIAAAQEAVARFGLGANSSPVISGTMSVHRQLENRLVEFFGLKDRGVSLFSSGYAVNLGVIQAFIHAGSHVICDRLAHMSILEGAKLSGGTIEYFQHNDPDDLETVLRRVATRDRRMLVCLEGLYSADGDFGRLASLVEVCKRYGAAVLVDEAHSVLVNGPTGRGTCEADGVLDEVDFYVMTFSKSFSGVGGAVLARKDAIRYINWYAKCRMFSCALDPGVTGGMVKALEIAAGSEGDLRRRRIRENADRLRGRLSGAVDLGRSESWIVTAIYGADRKTLELNHRLQTLGLDTSIVQFPAVPINEARLRIFVTSEHRPEQIDRAADIIHTAWREFGFVRN